MKPSSFIIFGRKVKGTGWTKRMIRRKFYREVEKDDWAGNRPKDILEHFYRLAGTEPHTRI